MSEENECKTTDPPRNCRFAIPRKGRMYNKCVEILKGAGIEFNRDPQLDIASCIGLPITLVFLPVTDIAKFVGKGAVDIGITGFDDVQEAQIDMVDIMGLGFGRCKLCLQAPVADKITNVKDLAGKRIATSFRNITSKFFKEYDEKAGTNTEINFVSGSVEAACGLGLADAVVDLVESGTTMRAAGLEIVHIILETEAVLISNPHSIHMDWVNLIKNRIQGYITATKYVMIVYNIENSLLGEAVKITPGKRSPTITSLEFGSFKSVSALVLKSDVSSKMDALQAVGATDILALAINNSRM